MCVCVRTYVKWFMVEIIRDGAHNDAGVPGDFQGEAGGSRKHELFSGTQNRIAETNTIGNIALHHSG